MKNLSLHLQSLYKIISLYLIKIQLSLDGIIFLKDLSNKSVNPPTAPPYLATRSTRNVFLDIANSRSRGPLKTHTIYTACQTHSHPAIAIHKGQKSFPSKT